MMAVIPEISSANLPADQLQLVQETLTEKTKLLRRSETENRILKDQIEAVKTALEK
jgi:hypothetical protein